MPSAVMTPWQIQPMQNQMQHQQLVIQAQMHPQPPTFQQMPSGLPQQQLPVHQQVQTKANTSHPVTGPPVQGALAQQTTLDANTILPILLGIAANLQVSNTPGKLSNLISAHVPLTIKNKVWSYMYIDLGSLLDNNTSNPDEEEQFDFFPDHVNQRISFKLTNKHAQINSFNAWNKAFRVLIELMEAKWNNLCLPMVQYKHIINEQAGKFPFQQVYAYDKHFH